MKSFKKISASNSLENEINPKAIGAEYEDGEISVEIDSILDYGKLSKRRFKAYADGKRLKIKTAIIDNQDNSFVLLNTLTKRGQVIEEDSQIKLTYRDPRGDQPKNLVQDIFGNDLESFEKLSVEVI